MPRTTRLDDWYNSRSEYLDDLMLAWSRTSFADVEASAALVEDYLATQLFDDVITVRGEEGSPAVFGQRRRAGGEAANILVLGLHDSPWLDGGSEEDIVLTDKGLKGPGIAGRFAPFLAHTEGFLGLAQESGGQPPVNMAVLSLDSAVLGTNQLASIVESIEFDDLDVILCTPSVAWDLKAPTVSLGARGELLVEIIVSTGRDLQVNAFGGTARNTLTVLTQILSDLRDSSGRITLPGFYNRAVPPTTAEREALSRDGYDPARWLVGSGATVLTGGPSPLERASAWPTVEITSINSGADGRLRSQTIPGSASATVNMSLVIGQRPAEIEASLRNWLESQKVGGVEIALNVIASSAPYQVQRDTPWVVSQARAAKRVFNRPPIPVLGGGMPGMAEIARELDVPMLFSGITSPASFVDTEHERLSNERLRLGMNVTAEIFEQFAKRAARIRPRT